MPESIVSANIPEETTEVKPALKSASMNHNSMPHIAGARERARRWNSMRRTGGDTMWI